MDYMEAKEIATNEAIAEAQVSPGDIGDYTIDQLNEVVDIVASEIFSIETGGDWENVPEEIKEEYIDRATELIGDGKIIDTYNNPEIDVPAKQFEGEVEHDAWANEEYTSYVTNEEGEVRDVDDEEVLEKQGYIELGDGLYISKEDYEENISEPDDSDSVCAN